MHMITAFLAGLLFGSGLILSGMSNPAKVLAFLDIAGQWDPSLGFVMLGAILVAAIAAGLSELLGDAVRTRTATLDEPDHGLPQDVIDATDVLTWWGHIAHDDVDDAIVTRCNAELANSFGNLAQRTFSMIVKNLEGVVPPVGQAGDDLQLLNKVAEAEAAAGARFSDYDFSAGLEAWMSAVFAANAYVDAQAPWALRKTDPERMAAVLGTLVAAVRELARAIAPIIPESADRLLTAIDAGAGGAPIVQPVPLFPRLELDQGEEGGK